MREGVQASGLPQPPHEVPRRVHRVPVVWKGGGDRRRPEEASSARPPEDRGGDTRDSPHPEEAEDKLKLKF